MSLVLRGPQGSFEYQDIEPIFYAKMFLYGWPGQQLNALFCEPIFFLHHRFLFYKHSNGNYLMSKCNCYNLAIYV